MTSKDFEVLVKKLLAYYNYKAVNPKNIQGRATKHQIDAMGISAPALTPTFSYPLTLLAEAKFYSGRNSVGIAILRNFYGVLEDIRQKRPNAFSAPTIDPNSNYIIGTTNIVGLVITTTSFTKGARAFAYAHGIFMVSVQFKISHRPFFANIGGHPAIVNVPLSAKLDGSIAKEDLVQYLIRYREIPGIYLRGTIELLEELAFNGDDEENNDVVFTYTYAIKLNGVSESVETITQIQLNLHEEVLLTIELPENKQYLTINLRGNE